MWRRSRTLFDAINRVRPATLNMYKQLSRQMEAFAQENGLRFLREFDPPMLQRFRASWPDHNAAALTKLWFLRAFFRFAHDCKWIEENPASKLASPRVNRQPSMPFTPEQVADILSACERQGPEIALRIEALVPVLLYTGLRLREGVTLERAQITGDKLFLRTTKTGTPVCVLLHPFVLDALAAVPPVSERYFFCADGSNVEAASHAWSRTLRKVFDDAAIRDGRAHRFRVTFAAELFGWGMPDESVAVLLGISKSWRTLTLIRPLGQASQAQLDAYVLRSWESPAFKKLLARFRNKARKTG